MYPKYSQYLDKLVLLLIPAQFWAFAVWGTLWMSLRNGLGRSYDVLDEKEISLVQKVRRRAFSQDIYRREDIFLLTRK